MSSNEIILVEPSNLNLVELAEVTSSAFKLLQPWSTRRPEHIKSLALRSIASQAQIYVRAINHSTTAAQFGFNFATEALSLAEFMDKSTEEERQRFLFGMLNIAAKGQENAEKAHDQFRDVRKTLEKLIVIAHDEEKKSGGKFVTATSHDANLKVLQAGISVLERFTECVSLYIGWWNMICMTEGAQKDRLTQVTINYSTLRSQTVVKRWRDLKQDYADYSCNIMAIQDAYPEMQALADAPDIVQPTLESTDGQSQPRSLLAHIASLFRFREQPSYSIDAVETRLERKVHRHRIRHILGIST